MNLFKLNRTDPLIWGFLVLLGLLGLQLSGFWVDIRTTQWTQRPDLVCMALIPLVTSLLVWQVSRRGDPNLRRFWQYTALFCFFFGNSFLLGQVLGIEPGFRPSLRGLIHLLGCIFLVLAVAQLWPRKLDGELRVRLLLDLPILTLTEILLLWCVYQGNLHAQFKDTALTELRFMLVFQAFILLMHNAALMAPRELRPFPRIFANGLAFLSIAITSFMGVLIHGSIYAPAWISYLTSLAFFLTVLAALSSVSPARVSVDSTLWYLPQVFFIVALSVLIFTLIRENLPDFEMHIAVYQFVAVAALVFFQQLMAALHNRRLNISLIQLNEGLEQRVTERSKELEASRNQLLAAERLASLGQLTAGLAHEVNTPLAAAMTSFKQADMLAQEYQGSIGNATVGEDDHREIADELGQKLGAGISSLERLGEIVRKMRSQTRQQNEGKMRVNLAALLNDTLDLLQHPAMKAKVKLSLNVPKETWAVCEPGRFNQVVTNLVTNAIHACEDARAHNPEQGQHVHVRLTDFEQEAWLEIGDDGPGIPEEVRQRMFEPLFTTKSAGRGTGLGLSIVKDIVTSNLGGTLEFETEIGKGTTFRVRIPKQEQAVLEKQEKVSSE